MTKVDKVPEMKARIINLLHDNLEELIQNPYGNYAVQHALDVLFLMRFQLLMPPSRFTLMSVARFLIELLTRSYSILIKNSLPMLSKNVLSTPLQYLKPPLNPHLTPILLGI